ncbi:UDP-glycosyltransferase 73C6-like [Senna tora]|uniref:UDP-glycosyltransferase 73C6-like n=1 Tax=Senna tora TaxID=362788 RepID=A0A834WIU9_9FABA|nr:UDP-glycosyltransferase 73C6-like [Senna tora]
MEVVVKKEEIERAIIIEELMGDRKEGEERRKRVNELVESAVEEGGSSLCLSKISLNTPTKSSDVFHIHISLAMAIYIVGFPSVLVG